MYLNQTALSGYEEMNRMVAEAIAAFKTYGLDIRTAQNCDVNGIAWGFASLLPDCGVQNLSMAINWTKGGPPFREQCPNGFFWRGPDGKRVLVWNGDGYQRGNQLGLLPLTPNTPLAVSRYYSSLLQGGYPHSFALVQIQGIGGDNRPPNVDICDAVHEWNGRFRNPRMRTATLGQFFERLGRQSSILPEVGGDWPDWWSDGVGSTAIETGLSRRAQALLQSSAALAAVGSTPGNVVPELDGPYNDNMVFDEHTWGGHNSIDEPWHPYNRMIWYDKAGHVHRSWHGALKLGERLLADYAEGKDYEILAFNPFVQHFKGPSRIAVYRRGSSVFRSDYSIRDESGRALPAEWVPGSDWSFLKMEMDIPPLSFRRFTVVPGEKGPDLQSVIKATGNSLSSPFYRLSWDAQGVCSWLDLRSGREWMDAQSPFRLGQLVYEQLPNPKGGRSGRMVLESRDGKPDFRRHFAVLDSVQVLPPGNFNRAVRLFQSLPGFNRVETEIRLYDRSARMDVTVTLDKPADYDPEAVYLPFPFDLVFPDVYLDLPGVIGRPWKEQLPGTCEDYYAVQDWLAVGNREGGVIVASEEAPLFQFEKIRTGDWSRSGPPKNGTVLGWLPTGTPISQPARNRGSSFIIL